MDAYYEGLALMLAKEPLELYRGLGFAWLNDLIAGKVSLDCDALKACPPNAWLSLDKAPAGLYPTEVEMFHRFIKVTGPTTISGLRTFAVSVTVVPKQLSRVEAWFSRNQVVLNGIIIERFPQATP